MGQLWIQNFASVESSARLIVKLNESGARSPPHKACRNYSIQRLPQHAVSTKLIEIYFQPALPKNDGCRAIIQQFRLYWSVSFNFELSSSSLPFDPSRKKSLTAIEAGSAFMNINYAAGTFPHRENFGLVVHRHRFLSPWEKASIKNELLRKKMPNCLPVWFSFFYAFLSPPSENSISLRSRLVQEGSGDNWIRERRKPPWKLALFVFNERTKCQSFKARLVRLARFTRERGLIHFSEWRWMGFNPNQLPNKLNLKSQETFRLKQHLAS